MGKKNILAAVLCLLAAVFVLTGCQLIRGVDVQTSDNNAGDVKAFEEELGKSSAVEIQDAQGNKLAEITEHQALANFIATLDFKNWTLLDQGKATEVSRQLIFKEEATIHLGETESKGLQEMFCVKTYRDAPEVSVEIWKINLRFSVPQTVIDTIDDIQ